MRPDRLVRPPIDRLLRKYGYHADWLLSASYELAYQARMRGPVGLGWQTWPDMEEWQLKYDFFCYRQWTELRPKKKNRNVILGLIADDVGRSERRIWDAIKRARNRETGKKEKDLEFFRRVEEKIFQQANSKE